MDEDIKRSDILNPLERDEFIDTVLDAFINYNHIENGLNTLNNRSNKVISIVYMEVFYKLVFNKWKDSIMNIDTNNLDEPTRNKIIILKEYLKDLKAINGRTALKLSDPKEVDDQDLKDALETYTWNKKKNNCIHINSDILRKSNNKPKVCLYLNCDTSKLHQIIIEFIKKCERSNLVYDFSFNESDFIDDNLIIFCDEKDQSKYIKIINEIIKEKELEDFIYNPPFLTGTINDNIGYGLTNTVNNEYLKKRYQHLEECVRLVAREWIIKLFDKTIRNKSSESIQYKKFLIHSLLKVKKKNIFNNQDIDINDKELNKAVSEVLDKDLYKILNYLLKPSSMFRLEVNYRSRKIVFNNNDIDDLLKEQVSLFRKVSDDFKKQVLYKIKFSSPNYDIDIANYAYDINTGRVRKKESKPLSEIYNLSPTDNINNDSDRYITSRKRVDGRIIDKNHTPRHKKSLLQSIKDIIGKAK